MKVKIKNTGNEIITFRYYLVNIVESLKPNDMIILQTKNDEELNYYLGLSDNNLSVKKDGDDPEPEPKILNGIYISTQPIKVAYMVGEVFDPKGMIVKATYNDGSEKEITNYTYTPIEPLTLNDKYINIVYDGYDTSLSITVTYTPPEELEETDDILDNVISVGDEEPYEGLGGTEEEIEEIFDEILN